MKEIIVLGNWEKAKLAIAECKTIDEVKNIRDKAEALRAYAKQAKESLVVQNNVCEIKLRCERKIGEMIPQHIRHGGSTLHDVRLIDLGISEIQSSRYQSVFSLPEEEFEKHIAEVKASNEELTTMGVIRMARKLEPKKEKTPELPDGKYQVIYADPPWKYDVDLSSGATRSPENNYPVMDLDELIKFGDNVKEISDKNCILFMWITAPKLNWMNDVLEAWGFEYKTNLIWDKIKPNMGHYSSVRHEILIIAGKGTCSPTCDGKTIQSVDSVQSIEKSARHSEKPNEFYEIIEKLYPKHNKIELFARNRRQGWESFGNEL